MKCDLDFCFRGDRKYVQASDLFTSSLNEIRSEVKELKLFDLSVHRIITKQMILQSIEKDFEDVASVLIKVNDGEKLYAMVERNENVECSRDYNEEIIVQACKLDLNAKSISIEKLGQFTFIEKVISLNKALLKELITTPGKWYFARIKIKEMQVLLSAGNPPLELIFKRNLGGKLTDTLIIINGQQVGNIYFSLL